MTCSGFLFDSAPFMCLALGSPGLVPVSCALGGLLAMLIFIFLAIHIRLNRGIRRTRKDLEVLAGRAPESGWFRWPEIEARVGEMALELSRALTSGDLTRFQDDMTPHCLQVYREMLDQWNLEDRDKVFEVVKLRRIRPLHVAVGEGDTPPELVVLIDMDVRDYLEDRISGKVMKGKTRVNRTFDTVWNLQLEEGKWRLHSVEDGATAFRFATRENTVNVESPETCLQDLPGRPLEEEPPESREPVEARQPRQEDVDRMLEKARVKRDSGRPALPVGESDS